jgi:hypothetical protein
MRPQQRTAKCPRLTAKRKGPFGASHVSYRDRVAGPRPTRKEFTAAAVMPVTGVCGPTARQKHRSQRPCDS